MSEFVHCHVHTHYSTLDGMCQIPELVARAKELGQHAIAITDHGVMTGIYDLYKECKKQKIQPIYGIEFYHKEEGYDKRFHLLALAKSMKGLKNLYKLHELSHKNKDGKFPILKLSDLFQYNEDIIISTACIIGFIPYLLLNNDTEKAIHMIKLFKNYFHDDFYIELQSNHIPDQAIANKELINLAKLNDIKLIATADTHYILKEDAPIHEMLLCMQTQDKMSNPKRFRFTVQDFWLKSEEELSDLPQEALRNTLEIANKCKFELELPKTEEALPKYSEDEKMALRELVNKGWKEKKHAQGKEEYDRANMELDIIESKGYSGYYLIVSDYINWAKSKGIVVGAGRGSGVGSFIAYLIGMTSINPLNYGLLFERFLNPERFTSPDFDVDFSDRDAVVEYLRERWGVDNIASIVAFGKLTAKAVIRKVLSIHGFDMATINIISKSLPDMLTLTLKDCEKSEIFRKYKSQHPELFNAMYKLEGTIDHMSTHAAGILITPTAINEFVPPLYDSNNNILVSGFDKYMLEELGLYKFDILKLKTLNVIDDSVKMIKQFTNQDIDLDEIDYEDANIYNKLCNGNVAGVFQLEDQQELTMKLQPKNFEAITALNALIRPGVGDVPIYVRRMNGEPFEYYSDLEIPYMSQTYNTITYQEQIMLRVNALAGWTLGKGDSLRKEKHIRENKELQRKYYADCFGRMAVHQMQLGDIDNSWEEIVSALEGGYSFNKSHACSYAKISYQTAWLKYYYPQYFMCALMTTERDKQEKIAERVQQCKQLGIKVLPPDINKSNTIYTCEGDSIRFAINTIHGVGEKALEEIERIKPVSSLTDLMGRGSLKVLDKRVMEALIKSGCFDFENPNRYDMLGLYYILRKEKHIAEAYKEHDISTLDIARFEKETLGLYLTASPFDGYNFKPLDAFVNKTPALIGGEMTKVKEIFDKNNNKMAFITLTTEYNNVELVVFSSDYNKLKDLIQEGNFVMVEGKRDNNKMIVNKIKILCEV